MRCGGTGIVLAAIARFKFVYIVQGDARRSKQVVHSFPTYIPRPGRYAEKLESPAIPQLSLCCPIVLDPGSAAEKRGRDPARWNTEAPVLWQFRLVGHRPEFRYGLRREAERLCHRQLQSIPKPHIEPLHERRLRRWSTGLTCVAWGGTGRDGFRMGSDTLVDRATV